MSSAYAILEEESSKEFLLRGTDKFKTMLRKCGMRIGEYRDAWNGHYFGYVTIGTVILFDGEDGADDHVVLGVSRRANEHTGRIDYEVVIDAYNVMDNIAKATFAIKPKCADKFLDAVTAFVDECKAVTAHAYDLDVKAYEPALIRLKQRVSSYVRKTAK